jgi:SSS family solute:Na+ symporter
MPEGPEQIFEIAIRDNKFSLGDWGFSWNESTVWVVLLYSLTVNLKNVSINQSYTQRYLSAKTEGEAKKSIWFGSLLYLPVSACFFFIGTSLYCYYTAQPELLPEHLANEWKQGKGDSIFPYFIMTCLPTGVRGVLIAAILAAAMSTISSSLNSSATLPLTDFYKRLVEPNPSEQHSMRVLYMATACWGIAGTGLAIAMIHVKSVLDLWWQMSGVVSGGMLGLFLLGFLTQKINSRAAATGVVAGILVIVWLTFSSQSTDLPISLRNPFHPFLTVVLGTISILLSGFIAGLLLGPRRT